MQNSLFKSIYPKLCHVLSLFHSLSLSLSHSLLFLKFSFRFSLRGEYSKLVSHFKDDFFYISKIIKLVQLEERIQ